MRISSFHIRIISLTVTPPRPSCCTALQCRSAPTVTCTQLPSTQACDKLPEPASTPTASAPGSAAHASNILQSNEGPYVPEFLPSHSESQADFMISELAWTRQVPHHMTSGFHSLKPGTKWLHEKPAISLESKLGNAAIKDRN